MPFLPLVNGAIVEVIHLYDGSICECGFTFIKRPFVGEPTLEELGTTVHHWWATWVLPFLAPALSYTRYRVTDISAAGGSVVETLIEPPLPGGYGGAGHPANVAARLNYRVVNLPGRLVGCTFVPGVPHGATTGNQIDEDWALQIEDAFSKLIDWVELHNWRWVIGSKYAAGVLRPAVLPLRVDIMEMKRPYLSQRRSRLHNDPLPPP